jgi:hypothetical protein
MFDPDDEGLRQISEIEQRVRPTVRLRHGYGAEPREGR